MPHKDARYYISTIYLKINAQLYDWANRTELLNGYKKRTKLFYYKSYDKHFLGQKITINHSFSKQYTTYNFFLKALDLQQQLRFNGEGVALCHLDAKEMHENPLLPAYFGLVCYNDFLINQNEDSLEKFWVQIKYLGTVGIHQNDALLFMYEGFFPLFDIYQTTWYSGITQSLIVSMFIRAFDLTQNPDYKKKARQTIEAMFIPFEEDGVFCQTPEGFDWIEEYPSVSRRSMVLNGFIFSIIALYEYLIICDDDKKLRKRLERLVESCFKTLHHYIRGSFVRYSRFNKSLQNINYQGLIVFQFLHLFEVSGNNAFRDIALRLNKNMNWAAYFRFHGIVPPPYFEDNLR